MYDMPDLSDSTALRHSRATPSASAATVLCAPAAEMTSVASIDSPFAGARLHGVLGYADLANGGSAIHRPSPGLSRRAAANFAGPPTG